MNASVAVVIPTRDRGQLLVHATQSALDASPPSVAIVIADGGSTDGSVDRAAALDPRVRVVRGRYRNAAATRNAGVAATEAELIAFLDSDDLMTGGKLACLTPLFTRSDVVLAHGRTTVIDESGAVDGRLTADHAQLFEKAERLGTAYDCLARWCAMFTSAIMVRRSAFDELGGYDESLDVFEDWDLYLRLSLLGSLEYAHCEAARYRVWPGNVAWDRTARGIIAVASKHLHDFPPLAEDAARRARFGFLRRQAESHHVLVELSEARRAVLDAIRVDTTAALRDSTLRRVLLRGVLPASVLRRRRSSAGRQ